MSDDSTFDDDGNGGTAGAVCDEVEGVNGGGGGAVLFGLCALRERCEAERTDGSLDKSMSPRTEFYQCGCVNGDVKSATRMKHTEETAATNALRPLARRGDDDTIGVSSSLSLTLYDSDDMSDWVVDGVRVILKQMTEEGRTNVAECFDVGDTWHIV